MEPNGVVERIRSLLARFSENEETVRRLVATDATFDALCHEYHKVIKRRSIVMLVQEISGDDGN